ncbi:hypothetical protein MIND_00307300 [Mycena indigotica]|uniref:Uncharacterized protein n=1 Tax=Mycena indigotica TaxID=2126181 RepID=A0A8H6T1L5_9AGAR|nr:uncharacterized protein MIND_00307300 [Mycena indigotica]KAF7309366.1 hypothetical protein MIND_00307300 [Mycena indigotica]
MLLVNRTFFFRYSSPLRALVTFSVVAYLFYLVSTLSGYVSQTPAPRERPAIIQMKEEKWKQQHGQDVPAGLSVQILTVTTTFVEVQTKTRTVQAPQATVTKEVMIKPKPKQLLRGLPTESFQDNLLPEVQYVTSWTGSGFTNDVMTFVSDFPFPVDFSLIHLKINLIYLGLLTQRVPVLPHFAPTHVAVNLGGTHTGPGIDFGEVFDIPRYVELTSQPLLEWWQIKDRKSTTLDPLGCWNVWESVSPMNKGPHWTESPYRLNLDVSYVTAPSWIKHAPEDPENLHTRFAALMSLGFPTRRNKSLMAASESPQPDDHMLCFDNMYWACDLEPHDMVEDWSASWRLVGQYLHWTPKIEGLADMYLRHAFGISSRTPIPPFIAIHVRRGDFADAWRCENAPTEECFAPISAYARRVNAMKREILETKGITVKHAMLLSDEEDENWWRQAMGTYGPEGWARANHVELETAKMYGAWYPILIDAAIQSHRMSMGIVGTHTSTVSILAGKRIGSWNNGAPVQFVKWGRWGPDDGM